MTRTCFFVFNFSHPTGSSFTALEGNVNSALACKKKPNSRPQALEHKSSHYAHSAPIPPSRTHTAKPHPPSQTRWKLTHRQLPPLLPRRFPQLPASATFSSERASFQPLQQTCGGASWPQETKTSPAARPEGLIGDARRATRKVLIML